MRNSKDHILKSRPNVSTANQILFHEKTTHIHADMYLLLPLLCCDSISKQVTIQNPSIRQKREFA